MSPLQEEKFPQTDKLSAIETLEKRPILGTSPSYQGILEGRAADVEEEEDNEYGAESGDEEDYGEEGGDEAAEGEYGAEDYGDEEEVEEWPPKD